MGIVARCIGRRMRSTDHGRPELCFDHIPDLGEDSGWDEEHPPSRGAGQRRGQRGRGSAACRRRCNRMRRPPEMGWSRKASSTGAILTFDRRDFGLVAREGRVTLVP
jgi:hypothetical protein